jgi:hypothetical protein
MAKGVLLLRRRASCRWNATACAWVPWILCILSFALGPQKSACAQSATDGAIGGHVVNATGKAVAGALVVVTGSETGLEVQTHSGRRGEFLIPRLPVGKYGVTVKAAGIAHALAEPVGVLLGDVTEVEVRLAPTAAGSPGRAAGEGADVTEEEKEELPVDGGDWRSLALTVPSANNVGDSDDSSGELSFRGVDATQNSNRNDGVSGDASFSAMRGGVGVEEDPEAGSDEVSDRTSGVGSGANSVADGGQRAGSSYAFSQAAVREFRVEGQGSAAAYGSALYGHGVGGVVTTVSRSGGTKLHGMGFYTVRDSAWAAVNPFSIESSYANGVVTSGLVKPADTRQQFGGSVGGQAPGKVAAGIRGRLFYFYAFDQQLRNFPAISSPGYAGFYALTATQTALLANRGVTVAKTNAALNYLNSLTGTVARRADQTVNFGRVDWQLKGGSRLVLEYNRARWSSPAGARSGAVVDRAVTSLGSSYGNVDAGVLRWVEIPRGGLSNELRVQYGRQLQYETAQSPLAQEPNVGPGGMPPEVSIGPDGLVFGTPAGLGQRAYPDERRLEAADVVAWVRGRHLVQFGGDFSALTDLTDSLSNAEGTFNYDSGATGGKAGGLVDWVTDYTFSVNAYPNAACPSIVAEVHYFCFRSYSQSFGQQSLSFATKEGAAFVQDDWRVSRTLTVHAGMRYELQVLPPPQQPNLALDAVFGAQGASGAFPEDRNNFGPRVGVAWQPFGLGRGVVRVGYGVYYGKLPGATVRTALLDTAMPTSTTRIRVLPTTETLCPQMTTVGFGYPCSFLALPAGVVAATTSAVVFDRRFRLPMVQQATVAVEHGVGLGVLGSVGYVMNLDRQLPNSVDINIAPSADEQLFQLVGGTGAMGARDGETFVVPVYSQRLSLDYGPVTDIVSNANATYHGVTVEARRGLGSSRAGYEGAGRGLEFRVGWTWSKAIDFGQNAGAVPRANGQFDPFRVRYDKGLSALNFPHRVVATVVWSPRVSGEDSGGASPTAERTVLRLANGWSLAGIFSEASGRGYSSDIFGGTRLTGGRESINGSGGSAVLPTVGRNTLRLQDSANLDVRVSRSFRLSESVQLRGAAEIFNAMNHLNYSGVTQRAFLAGTPGTDGVAAGVTPLVFQDAATVAAEGLNVLPFGAYTAASTSETRERQVQLGLRVEF